MWEWVNPKSLAAEERRKRVAQTEAHYRHAMTVVIAWRSKHRGSRDKLKAFCAENGISGSTFYTAKNYIENLQEEPDVLAGVLAGEMTIKQGYEELYDRWKARDYKRLRSEPYMDRDRLVAPQNG